MNITMEIDGIKVYISSDVTYLNEFKDKAPVVLVLDESNMQLDTTAFRYAVMLGAESEEIDKEYLRLVVARYLNKPFIISSNDKLVIAEMHPDHAGEIARLYKESKPEFLDALFSENEDGKELIQKYITEVYDFYGYGIWEVIFDNKIIGIAGLIQRDNGADIPDLELGYFISKVYQNRGFGYKACCQIIEYAKENFLFDNIFVNIDRNNIISEKLAKKLNVKINYIN